MTGFAVGEEAEQAGNVVIREVGQIAAPIDRAGVKLRPGSTARVDVVVRTALPVKSAKEYTEPRDLTPVNGKDGTELRVRVHPGDVQIVHLVTP